MNINNQLAIRKELIQIASSNLLSTSFVLLLNVYVLSVAFWNVVDKISLTSWFSSLTFLIIIRNINAASYMKNKAKASLSMQEYFFKSLALITALILSVGLQFLLLNSPTELHQAFIAMVIAGISTGLVVSFSIYQNLARTYLTILIAPLIYNLYSFNTQLHFFISILITLFLIFVLIVSKNYHNNILKVIKSKILIKKSKKDLKQSQEHFYTIFEKVPVGVFTFGTDLIIKEANQAFARVVDAPLKKLINFNAKTIDNKAVKNIFESALKGRKELYEGSYKTFFSNKNIYISMQTAPMYDAEKNIIGGLGIVEDITARIENEKKIKKHAYYDHLTGLANRITLNTRLDREVSRLQRHNRCGALLFIDIDKFKTINDSLGHDIGDVILKTFASRTLSAIRKEDTVARYGGDEFIILLSDLSHKESQAIEYSINVAEKLHNLMKTPIKIENHTLNITLSIGIASISTKDKNVDQIIKNADVAMYEAKTSGRNTTYVFKENTIN